MWFISQISCLINIYGTLGSHFCLTEPSLLCDVRSVGCHYSAKHFLSQLFTVNTLQRFNTATIFGEAPFFKHWVWYFAHRAFITFCKTWDFTNMRFSYSWGVFNTHRPLLFFLQMRFPRYTTPNIAQDFSLEFRSSFTRNKSYPDFDTAVIWLIFTSTQNTHTLSSNDIFPPFTLFRILISTSQMRCESNKRAGQHKWHMHYSLWWKHK